jgi:hypothetical protein
MKTRIVFAFLLIVGGFLAAGCTNESSDTFVSTGTVVYLSFEGGFYGIKGDDGRNYDPLNLPVELRKDGLRIRFEARELPDRGSFHMWGRIIEIKHVEKL